MIWTFVLGLVLFLMLPVVAQAGEHPRLLFGPGDVEALRQKVQREPWKSMLHALRDDAQAILKGRPDQSSGERYDQYIAAQELAFLYLMTRDDAYAKQARQLLETEITDFKAWTNSRTKGLTLYWQAVHVAWAYDWCSSAPSWDPAFRKKISEALLAIGQVIYFKGGTEQNRSTASNWQGNRYSAAGICFLATDESYPAEHLLDCYRRVTRYLRDNLGPSPNSRGWNIEGLGYTYYPMGNFVGPFGIAIARHNPTLDVRKDVPAVRWNYWTCFAGTSTMMGNIHPDFGDDNPHANGEGTYGQAFYYSPPELLPGIKYWYDRLEGDKGTRKYDVYRAGAIYSILYYPDSGVTPADPMTIPAWRNAFADTAGNGMILFRNRYQDKDDMIAQLYLKLRGNKGHSGPDALSFRIFGLNTPFVVGGGRYGIKSNGQDAYLRSMTTLYPVDPDSRLKINDESGKILQEPVIGSDGGGCVVAGMRMNNLGVKNHVRRFVADYSPRSGAAATYIICDSSDNGIYWQLCTLETNAITTSGNTFTIAGADGNVMIGTVLYPTTNLRFRIGQRPRGSNFVKYPNNNFIHFQSDDGHFLVVLTCLKRGQTNPRISATGTWSGQPVGEVTVGNLKIKIDGEKIVLP